MQINTKNTALPSFKAKPIAQIIPPTKEQVILYALDREYDRIPIQKLKDSFTLEKIQQRFPNCPLGIQQSFIRHCFNSINKDGQQAILSTVNGIPSGFMSYDMTHPSSQIHLSYLTSWKPDNLPKIKNNSLMLIRHLFETAQSHSSREINVTPGYNTKIFYEKLGFEEEDFEMKISHSEILKQLLKIDKKFQYDKIAHQDTIDLLI